MYYEMSPRRFVPSPRTLDNIASKEFFVSETIVLELPQQARTPVNFHPFSWCVAYQGNSNVKSALIQYYIRGSQSRES